MMRTATPRDRRARSWVIAAVATLFGAIVMLFTIALGAGDTSVGNSNSPWIAGEVIVLGIPVAIGGILYVVMRRSGASRLRAVLVAVAAPPTMLIVIGAVFWILVSVA
jgi:hypothetical protein